MNRSIPFLTGLRFGMLTLFFVSIVLVTTMLAPAMSIGAPLNVSPLAIDHSSLLAINGQTKALLHVDEGKFAKAPVAQSIKSEKARDILLDQDGIEGVKALPIKSEGSGKTVATFLHLNPAVASDPEPSIPTELEVLKEKLTRKGVVVPARLAPAAEPMQPMIKPIEPAAKPMDKVSDVIKGLFKDSNN